MDGSAAAAEEGEEEETRSWSTTTGLGPSCSLAGCSATSPTKAWKPRWAEERPAPRLEGRIPPSTSRCSFRAFHSSRRSRDPTDFLVSISEGRGSIPS